MARQRCDFPIFPNQLILISIGSDTCLNWKWWTKHDQTPNFSDPKSSEILRSNSCDLARPVAISSGALRTEAPGRCTLRLRKATWRWSRRCSPRAPPSRRRTTTAAALRDGTDVTGRTWWEGGAADFRMKFDGVRHLNVTGHWVCCQFWELRSRNLQCTLRDSVLRMSTTSRQQMQVSVAGCCGYVTLDIMTRSGSGGWVKLRRHFAGLVLLIMADGCKLILMISCLDCSVFLWIFDLVCSVWHGRGVTSQYFPISWSWFR